MEDTERVRFYARELLSGKPAKDVPRKHFPKIQAILEGMKTRAINDGNTSKVRQSSLSLGSSAPAVSVPAVILRFIMLTSWE